MATQRHPRTRGCARLALTLNCPRAHPAQLAGCSVTHNSAHVTSPDGIVTPIPDGTRLVFGRGPDADLIIPGGLGLSRRAGAISAMAGGAWVANISHTHALYAEGDGYRVRLPRLDDGSEPAKGWFLQAGAALVGSRSMLDEGRPLRLVVQAMARGRGAGLAAPADARDSEGCSRGDRRTSRAAVLRHRSGLPGPALGARRRARESPAAQAARSRHGPAGSAAVRRGCRCRAHRSRHRHLG